jgi:hypothetical protein
MTYLETQKHNISLFRLLPNKTFYNYKANANSHSILQHKPVHIFCISTERVLNPLATFTKYDVIFLISQEMKQQKLPVCREYSHSPVACEVAGCKKIQSSGLKAIRSLSY